MRMKKSIVLVPLIVIMVLVCTSPLMAAEGVFKEVSGKVEYQLPGGSWRKASVGVTVPVGARISTGFNSEASIELKSTLLKVRSLTRMSIEELVEEEGVISTDLNLKVGRVRAEVKSTQGIRHDFRLRSPYSTAAVKGTLFEYDGVNIIVYDGTVRYSNVYNIGGNVSGGENSSTDGGDDPLLGAAARKRSMRVVFDTLPDFQPLDDLLVLPGDGGSPDGVEYGSIGGTVSFE